MSRKVKTSYQGNGNKENISHLVWNRKLLMKLGKGISVKMLRIKSEIALLMTHDIKKQKKCFLKVNNTRGFANRIA